MSVKVIQRIYTKCWGYVTPHPDSELRAYFGKESIEDTQPPIKLHKVTYDRPTNVIEEREIEISTSKFIWLVLTGGVLQNWYTLKWELPEIWRDNT